PDDDYIFSMPFDLMAFQVCYFAQSLLNMHIKMCWRMLIATQLFMRSMDGLCRHDLRIYVLCISPTVHIYHWMLQSKYPLLVHEFSLNKRHPHESYLGLTL
ncbi:hypothetical protein SCLCIDRAFT_1213198, partial [Scleroderma citrinum Foug A]